MSPTAWTVKRCDDGLLPNALARTLITMHSGEYGSLNKRRFGQFSESLCIAQIIPLAVSSSTPWRIYA